MGNAQSTNVASIFRTSVLKDAKTFDIRTKLTKPSQSIIVYITSVGHFYTDI